MSDPRTGSMTSPSLTPQSIPELPAEYDEPVTPTNGNDTAEESLLRSGAPSRTPSNLDSNEKPISARHYERLIEELKCPGCSYPTKGPVLLCNSGHSVCESCTKVLLICPLCKATFTNIRSLTVEALCSKAHFKCSNASGGCTVRLQLDLLTWHEKQCIYKPMKCFMGRVWGNCDWNGREAHWKQHLESAHANKVFTASGADLIWNMGVKQKPLTGYYVFEVYEELFNFYEIFDKERVLFTMTCTSTMRERKHRFAFEVTVIHEDNDALAISHKLPVHSEYDADILAEGTCVSIPLADLAKFIDEEKLLHYRVSVLEVKSPRRSRILQSTTPTNDGSGALPIDFQQTNIQGVNLKNVPADVIVTRRLDDIPFADAASKTTSTGESSEDEVEKMRRMYEKKLAEKKQRNSASDSDPEFEAFVARKWGTPQLHFNRKYLKSITPSDSSSCSGRTARLTGNAKEVVVADADNISVRTESHISYKKKMSNTLRKSFRALRTDIIDMKTFGRMLPEKKTEK